MLNRKEKRLCQRLNNSNKHTQSTSSKTSSLRRISIVFSLACCLLLSLSAFGVNAESAVVGYESGVIEYANPEHQRIFDMDLRSICFEVYGSFPQEYDTAIIQVDPPVFNSVFSEWDTIMTMADDDGNEALGTAYVDWFDWGTFQFGTPYQWHAMECTVTFDDKNGFVPPAPCYFYAYFGDSYIDEYTTMDIRFLQDYDVGMSGNEFTFSYRAYWIEDGQLRYNSYYERVPVETETGDSEGVLSIVTDDMRAMQEQHGEIFVTDLVVYGHALSSQILIEGSEKQYGYQNFSDWIQLRNITVDPSKIDSELPTMFGWLGRSLTEFLNIPIFENFTLGGVLGVMVSVSSVLIILKFFAGG